MLRAALCILVPHVNWPLVTVTVTNVSSRPTKTVKFLLWFAKSLTISVCYCSVVPSLVSLKLHAQAYFSMKLTLDSP